MKRPNENADFTSLFSKFPTEVILAPAPCPIPLASLPGHLRIRQRPPRALYVTCIWGCVGELVFFKKFFEGKLKLLRDCLKKYIQNNL